MQLILINNNTLLLDDFEFKCSIGKKGRSKNKKEGDFKTPIGVYKIDTLFYRKDKYPNTITKLKKIPIQKDMGWCDDVNSRYYNKLIKLNKNVRHEKLFKKNSNYDLLIPISYNTKRPIKNKGSAIFIHLTKNYKKTLGCIAIKENDMLVLLKIVNKKTKIKII